jgi:hypothetical protein
MCSEDFASLHDIFEDLEKDERSQKTTYVVQFLWRDLSSDFDVIGPILQWRQSSFMVLW